MSVEGRITTEVSGRLLLIGIDRMEKKNSFTPRMYLDLGDAYARLDQDPELWCGVLFAHGNDFTAGLDLPQFASVMAEGKMPVVEGSCDPCGMYGPYPRKPVVTAMHGLCLTIGIELMLAADIRVAAKGTRFGQIEIKRGIYPFGGATIRYVQEAGWGNAMRYLLTADEFSAEEAYRIGMVQEVVEDGKQLERAVEIATTIAEQAPLAVQATLKHCRKALYDGEKAAAAALMDDLATVAQSEDAMEGIQSFIERRKANFKGR
ncbi:crotonase/enoyl-CoA hydratase family protein [bacterium]|nr:crotonase/enoyl-CoA hydratase family protein [bacterium]